VIGQRLTLPCKHSLTTMQWVALSKSPRLWSAQRTDKMFDWLERAYTEHDPV